MIRRITIILSIFFMKTLLSCEPCGNFGDVEDYRLDNFQISSFAQNANGTLDSLMTPAQVGIEDLRILIIPELVLENDFVAANMGFSSSYACSPPSPPSVLDYIMEVSITSNQDYYSYAAGENLIDIFNYADSTESEGYSLEELKFYPHNEFYFSIIIPPDIQSDHEFTFSFTLDDGREFSKTTQPLTILPYSGDFSSQQ